MSLKLKIITGSTRPGRVGPTIASWVTEAAKAHGGFEVEEVDLADIGLPFLDEPAHPAMKQYEHEHTKTWSRVIDEADAFVFLVPEYDSFPPATLVNAVQVILHEWRYKPAGVVSYGGISGGLRASQEFRQLLGNVGMVALPQSVPVPFFSEFLTDEGTFVPNEKIVEGTNLMFAELVKWAGALQPLHAAA